MHSNRIKHLMVAMLAVFALGAVASASASAAPTWRASGVELAAAKKITINSDTSRLWAPSLGLMIICAKDEGTGVIENVGKAGIDTATVTFSNCAAWSTQESSEEQVIQKEKLTCEVPNIVVKTKTKLAYVPGSGEKEVVDVQEPAEGTTFVTIVLKKCTLEEGEYPVTGSVIGKIPRVQLEEKPTEEAVMGDLLFETNNEPKVSKVTQRYPEYELGGVKTKDTLELKKAPAAFESTEVIELAPNAAVPLGPEPFGVHK